MRATNMKSHRRAAGFTLIELMVTIIIGAILMAIAGPAYMTQIRKSRRTEAKTAILDLASREERLYSTTNTYSADPVTLGYTAFGGAIGGGYYKLTVQAPTGAVPTFQVTATAINSQLKDTACFTFVVDQTGKLTAQNNATTDSTAQCLN